MGPEMWQKLLDMSYEQAWNFRGTEPGSYTKTSFTYL